VATFFRWLKQLFNNDPTEYVEPLERPAWTKKPDDRPWVTRMGGFEESVGLGGGEREEIEEYANAPYEPPPKKWDYDNLETKITDFDDYVEIMSYVVMSRYYEDEPQKVIVRIFRNKNTIAKVNIPDLEEDVWRRYDIKKRRWISGSPFTRTPQKFIKMVIGEWERVNGPLDGGYPKYQSKRKKAAPAPTHVEYTKPVKSG